MIRMRIHGIGEGAQMLQDDFRSRAAFPVRGIRYLDKKPRYLFQDGTNQRLARRKIEKDGWDSDSGLSRDFGVPRAAYTTPREHAYSMLK